uniref:Uncharacterized protein n=1 Tax=Peronospora matthiolae TaxID=2874970 RepID=A0AAV1T282_9STRA
MTASGTCSSRGSSTETVDDVLVKVGIPRGCDVWLLVFCFSVGGGAPELEGVPGCE